MHFTDEEMVKWPCLKVISCEFKFYNSKAKAIQSSWEILKVKWKCQSLEEEDFKLIWRIWDRLSQKKGREMKELSYWRVASESNIAWVKIIPDLLCPAEWFRLSCTRPEIYIGSCRSTTSTVILSGTLLSCIWESNVCLAHAWLKDSSHSRV